MAALAVVVVAHDSADGIERTLEAVHEQLLDGDELVVVDNGSRDGTPELARPLARVIEGDNVGFAAGCHVGARATRGELLLFLNPDAVPAPGCLDALREAPAGWGAWQALVTMEDGATVNTAGNVVHFLGFGWAGRCGEPVAAAGSEPRTVGFPSGAALVVRRRAWEALGGFDERYFMYGEDLDLGLRLWLAGWGCGVVPAARVAHDYEFAKGDYKWFYLERNRWWTVLGAYPARLLVALAPALLAFEIALLVAAWRGGWLRAKLRAQRAVLSSLPAIARRRRAVQATRRASAREFAAVLEASMESPYLAGAAAVPGVRALQAAYWRAAVAVLG